MFQSDTLEHAVDLQARSYALLRWMADGIQRGFIAFDAAHAYADDPRAAAAWIERHYAEFPPDARPRREHLSEFCNLFASYLSDGHRLVAEPGLRRYSPDAHCFCQMCSWFIHAPSLRSRPLSSGDQRRADRRMRDCLDALALEHERLLEDAEVSALMRDADLREALALYAYTETLLRRLQGWSVENGVPLALWRRFAWTANSAPKRKFQLSAEAILAAQRLLHERLAAPV